MGIGRTIRIYLKDGSVSGIKHAEIVNWTGQAVSVPRALVKSLDDWSDQTQRTGVYFLFGFDDRGRSMAYIGEAENVYTRLQDHVSNKDFWNEVVIFTSKDENVTKSHSKYLESRLAQIARSVDRYQLQNGNRPQIPSLPRGDRDAMEEFISNLKLLLGVIGHKVLEPLAHVDTLGQDVLNVDINETRETISELQLFYKTRSVDAKAVVTNEGFVVLAGSKISTSIAKKLPSGILANRNKLINQGIIKEGEFLKNYLFSSSSQAACVVSGQSRNGKDCWKNDKNQSLKEIENNESST